MYTQHRFLFLIYFQRAAGVCNSSTCSVPVPAKLGLLGHICISPIHANEQAEWLHLWEPLQGSWRDVASPALWIPGPPRSGLVLIPLPSLVCLGAVSWYLFRRHGCWVVRRCFQRGHFDKLENLQTYRLLYRKSNLYFWALMSSCESHRTLKHKCLSVFESIPEC